MKIEEGKCYRSREGKKVGPIERGPRGSVYFPDWPWRCQITEILYTKDGMVNPGREHPYDLISEWKEEEPAMDYATMNEIVDRLAELVDAKYSEISAFSAKKGTEISEINALIERIESQYPKPDEEEK